QDDGLDAGSGAIGGERGGGVTGGSASDGLDGSAFRNHLFDLGDQDRHAEVFEGATMGVAAEFDPELVDADHFSKAPGPEEVCAALVKRDNVLVVNFGENPLLFAPDAGADRPLVAFIALFEKLFPAGGVALAQGGEVVLDFEQGAAFLAMVDD